MFYDVGLVVLTLAVILGEYGQRAAVPMAMLVAASWLQTQSDVLGFSPVFVVLVATALWAARMAAVRTDEDEPSSRASSTASG